MKSIYWLGVLVVLAGCEAGPGPNYAKAEEPHSREELVDAGRLCLEKAMQAHREPDGAKCEALWVEFNELVEKRNRINAKLGNPVDDFDKVNVGYWDWNNDRPTDSMMQELEVNVGSMVAALDTVAVADAADAIDAKAGDLSGVFSSNFSDSFAVNAIDCNGDCGKCMGCAERAEDAALQKRIEDAARKVFHEEVQIATSPMFEVVITGNGESKEPPLRTKEGHLTVAGLIAELEKVKDKSKSACDRISILEDSSMWSDEERRKKVRGHWLGLESIQPGTGGPGDLQWTFTYTDTPAP